jgi:integrase/recombinase XerD
MMPATGTSLSVGDAVDHFLDHCRAKRLSSHTLRAYRGDLCDFQKQVGKPMNVTEIDDDTIRRYARALLDGRNLTATTARRRIATLKVLFRWLEQERLVAVSLFHRLNLSMRVPKRLPRTLHAEEMRLLLKVAEAEVLHRGSETQYPSLLMHFVVVTLFTTGLRIGELVAAPLSGVYPPDGAIHVRGKGNRERRVYMPGRQALGVLNRFLGIRRAISTTNDQLLVTAAGTAVSAQSVRKRLRALGAQAGISRPVTPHMLRHTAATQLIEAGVDIRFVQQLLGHSSIATTQIYTQISNASLRDRLVRADTLSKLTSKEVDS